jgi:hypothetical protein
MITDTQSDQEFVYHIDREDRVIFCDTAWHRFACENNAPELDTPEIIGRPLLDFVATQETRVLYTLLMAKARTEQRTVVVTFRCDGPLCRRMMRLEIAPLEGDALRFTSVLVEEEPRPYMALLDPDAPRSDRFIAMCGWCKQVKVDETHWLEVEAASEALHLLIQPRLPQITHSICQSCYARAVAALE